MRNMLRYIVFICFCCFLFNGCGQNEEPLAADLTEENRKEPAEVANFNHKLDGYKPRKQKYNFYFTYKTVHPWWMRLHRAM